MNREREKKIIRIGVINRFVFRCRGRPCERRCPNICCFGEVTTSYNNNVNNTDGVDTLCASLKRNSKCLSFSTYNLHKICRMDNETSVRQNDAVCISIIIVKRIKSTINYIVD